MNVFITKNIEMKGMRFNTGIGERKSKCQQMHVGKRSNNCLSLTANNKPLDKVKDIVYLGDIISSNGSDELNIKSRISRGHGILNDIFTILNSTCFGPHYFEIALLLRQSLLASSVLYNSTVWYNVTKKDLYEIS